MKIAQFTDFHFDDFLAQRYGLDTPANFATMLDDVVGRGFDRLAVTGDFGVPDRYPWLADRLRATGLPFDVILGNHDVGSEKHEAMMRAGLVEANSWKDGEYYYSRDLDGIKAVFLDTSRGEISERQKVWVETELELPGDVIVFVHHPVLDCGTAMDLSMALRGRDKLADLLIGSGKRVWVFCGHYHFTHEVHWSNVTQFVTPACIMQIRGEGSAIVSDSFDFGYRVIELSEEAIATDTVMFVSPRKVLPGE